ncbi:cell division protein FtsZ [Flavobacteriaceae bacterium Ap0902]|nr:cell division protein FtsZ [Flavobacteriaceae bacterium Ap0902]
MTSMDFNNISFDLPKNKSASIKVIGVGGGGSNAVNYMFQQGITGVDFVVSNTDAQALYNSPVPNKVQLGASITEGLGAGANPEVGEQAALESIDDIKALLDSNTKMLFITAGMGGGTGTGAAPVIASIAKEMGILTVGICTAPFYFEGKMRMEQAAIGIEKFRNNLDSLIIINNDKLRELYGNLGYKTGFAKADEVLATAAKGIAEVITHHYATNIDLRDARTVLADSGTAIMGSAEAEGENKAYKAIEKALDSPLLNDNKITGAQNVLLLIVSGEDEVTMDEIGTINDYIQGEAGNNANIIMGIGEDPELGEKMSVTVIATGFPQDQKGFNGKEEKTIVHKLEEDQPLEQVFSKKEAQIKEPETPQESEKTSEFSLDDETEEMKLKESPIPNQNVETKSSSIEKDNQFRTFDQEEKDYTNDFDSEPTIDNSTIDFTFKTHESSNQPKKQKQEDKFTLFTLEEDWEEETETPVALNPPKDEINLQEEVKSEQPTPSLPEINQKVEEPVQEQERDTEFEDPFDAPIDEVVDQQIKERRERLKKFNFKFKSALKDVDEAERIPAYKRKNINLTDHSSQGPSNYILDKDSNGEDKIRPNNFLHDNVD